MANKKINVLFIAKNIPVPRRKSNRIIFDIANNISKFATVSFLFPKEIVPFWLRKNKRFAYLYKLINWTFEGYKITPIRYLKLPFKRMQYWTLFSLPISVKKYLRDNKKLDLVHAHYLLPDGFIAYKVYKKYETPYVLTFRSQDKQYLELISQKNRDYKKARRIITNAKKVLTPNMGYKKFVEDRFNVKCQIVPHGINSSIFETTLNQKPNDSIIITTVGDAIPTKNIEWVIKAFQAYKGKQKVKLNIIGDGPLLNNLKEITGNDERIIFWGRIPHEEVLTQMRTSDIFALPSSKETFGMVYLEAAATQNAIIGYKDEGVWGVFEQNEEMLFCDSFSVFKDQLFKLIDDKQLSQKLQRNAYTKAKTMEWSKIKEIYEDIYTLALN